jgi:hypothetical protein
MSSSRNATEGPEQVVIATATTIEDARFIMSILRDGGIVTDLRSSGGSVEVVVACDVAAEARRRLRAIPDF